MNCRELFSRAETTCVASFDNVVQFALEAHCDKSHPNGTACKLLRTIMVEKKSDALLMHQYDLRFDRILKRRRKRALVSENTS
jgi:hypothetical protein